MEQTLCDLERGTLASGPQELRSRHSHLLMCFMWHWLQELLRSNKCSDVIGAERGCPVIVTDHLPPFVRSYTIMFMVFSITIGKLDIC